MRRQAVQENRLAAMQAWAGQSAWMAPAQPAAGVLRGMGTGAGAAAMRVTCNGQPAQVEDLLPALVNYGHFTSLQVRGHAVQGLDLHLARLSQATRALFGSALDTGQVRGWMAQALRRPAWPMPRCG